MRNYQNYITHVIHIVSPHRRYNIHCTYTSKLWDRENKNYFYFLIRTSNENKDIFISTPLHIFHKLFHKKK